MEKELTKPTPAEELLATGMKRVGFLQGFSLWEAARVPVDVHELVHIAGAPGRL